MSGEVIRVDYTCRVCGMKQADIVVGPDSTVVCSDCEDELDVSVYLFDLDRISAERDPQMEVPEW